MIDDMAEVYCRVERKARKVHTCRECGGRIVAGEVYVHHSGIWSGGPATYKVCSDCEELRSQVDAEATYPEDRTAFGQLQESVFNACEPEWIRQFVAIKDKRGATVPDWMRQRAGADLKRSAGMEV